MTTDHGRSSLRDFELRVMLAVLHTGEGYSRSIQAAIEERTRRGVARGALYVTLDRLTEKGLLTSRMGQPRRERGGKARRYYTVTEDGLAAVREARASLQRMWAGLDEALTRP